MDRSSLRSFSRVLLVGAALFASSTPARSQPAPAKGSAATIEEDSRRADELFKQGKSAYQAGKIQEAHDAYARAWALKRSHDIASNLGNTELQLGMHRAAAEHLGYCVRNFPPTVDEAKRQNTIRRFEQARAEVGALLIKTNVRGAEVFVDGRSVGTAPLEAEVYAEPGERVIEARLAQHEPAVLKVRVAKAGAKGPAQDVALTLVPTVKGPEPPRSVGPAVPPPLGTTALPQGPNKAVLIAGGSVAGAALVAGVVLTVLANQKAADAAADRTALMSSHAKCTISGATPACAALSDATDARAALSNGAAWTFIGAGVLGVGTLVYALVPRKAATTTGLRVEPILGAQRGGLLIHGAW